MFSNLDDGCLFYIWCFVNIESDLDKLLSLRGAYWACPKRKHSGACLRDDELNPKTGWKVKLFVVEIWVCLWRHSVIWALFGSQLMQFHISCLVFKFDFRYPCSILVQCSFALSLICSAFISYREWSYALHHIKHNLIH